jgi:hypothetical protein
MALVHVTYACNHECANDFLLCADQRRSWMETEQPDLLANLELRRIGSSTFRRNSGVRTVKRRNYTSNR